MKCSDIHNNLISLIENDLSEDLKVEISDHIENCSDCKFQYLTMQKLYSEIEKEKSIKVDPFLFSKIENKVNAKKTETRSIKMNFSTFYSAAAIAIVLIIGTWFGTTMANERGYQQYKDYELSLLLNDYNHELIEQTILED